MSENGTEKCGLTRLVWSIFHENGLDGDKTRTGAID